MKLLLVKIGLWVARLGGWTPIAPDIIESAFIITKQAETMKGGGEFKRREALRAMMNRHPNAKIKDLAFAIEWVLR